MIKKLFIFDIDNIKKHYSRCLELIMSLEQNEPLKIIEALKRFNGIKKDAIRFFSSSNNIPPPRVIENEVLTNSILFKDLSNFENDPKNTKYHIRININNNLEYSNLQYLALLLKRLEYMTEEDLVSQKHRLTVFFCDSTAFYDEISIYLRLLAKESVGTIFAEDNNREVSAINFREYVSKSDFIPLIPINVDSYNELVKPIFSDTFDELFSLRKEGRFGDSRNKNPKIALPDFLKEVSYYKLKDIFENKKETLEKLRNRLNNSTFTLMHFVIFAFLNKRYGSKIIDDNYFNMVYTLSEDIYIGIRQIIENVIQYSELKCGFLQLMLRNENDNQFLEIRISDLNNEETMIDNFKKKLEYEKNTEPQLSIICENLLGFGEKMNISNFFDDAEDDEFKDAWEKYRNKIGMRHFGLRIFRDILLSCYSNFQIISNNNYKFDEKAVYSSDDKKEYEDDDMIPGTEIFVSIPLSEDDRKEELYSSAQLNYFNEKYECFASFLDYQAIDKTNELFEIFKKNRISREKDNDFNIANPVSKEEFTEIWAASFNQLKKQINKEEMIYFNIDGYFTTNIEYFGNPEVFSRGIFRGLLLRKSHDKTYIAIINTSHDVKEAAISQIKVRGGFRDTVIDSSIQLYFHVKDTEESLTLFGNTVQEAIQNAYLLSLEHGLGLIKHDDLYPRSNAKNDKVKLETPMDTKVMPFDVQINVEINNEKMSLFDKKIKFIANKKIDDNEAPNVGFLIKDTHTRLGSKIHIDGFFEMSFLFYRTSIANRIAFEIIQNIKKNGIDIKSDKLLFYGYASYSKAIITSLVEIVGLCRNKEAEKIRFVIYQHNLQTETSKEDIQLFHGHGGNNYLIPIGTNIIQIVPISSTFTTFNKMWDMFKETYIKFENNEWLKEYDPVLNYTVFWVFDDIDPLLFSKYIKYKNFLNREINTVDNLVKNKIHFLISSQLTWNSPLGCNKCFPEDIFKENIIVETDKTSTVPAQQFRLKNNNSRFPIDDTKRDRNNKALLKLLNSNCIKYGHIVRGKNHFQYYINTQELFYMSQKDIMDWLKGLKSVVHSDNSKLNIIFVPEHNTNVGFAQFVNIYCFNGTAEVISINIDKEYRTNFICEHKAIKATIKILLDSWKADYSENCPIKFYFVDDSIITGSTFIRANDLLLSLLPEDKIKYFSTNIFTKIFVLVDRLSFNSKNAYVKEPMNNFHTFMHIDISSMRTNGDSCVCCKLKSEAEKLFAKSSTKKLAEYWYNKIKKRNSVHFDDNGENDRQAALRLLISHIAYNYLFNNPSFTEEELINKLYDIFLNNEVNVINKEPSLFDDILYDSILIDEIKKQDSLINRISLLTKILSRPYFSFDSKYKQAILSYLIKLAGDIFKNNNDNKIVKFLQKESDEEKQAFLLNVVLESLSDLRSTFYLRKETIENIALYIEKLNIDDKCVENFYGCFEALIHSAIDCGNDETKPLWFEYLLLFGDEYNIKFDSNSAFKSLYSSFTFNGKKLNKTENIFKKFCDELFLMNSSILFKGIEMSKNTEKKKDVTKQEFDYFMNNWIKFREIDKTEVEISIIDKEIELFNAINDLNEHNNTSIEKSLNDKYKRVFDKLTDTLKEKYRNTVFDISYALLTLYAQHTNDEAGNKMTISDFDIISMTGDNQISPENSLKKYRIKEFICKEIENDDLQEWGYKIFYEKEEDWNENINKIAIFFDNPKDRNKKLEYYSKRELKNITPVYLYIEYKLNDNISMEDDKEKYSLLILRDILMYRNRFMRALESDFSSEIFGQYAHKRDEANLIAHEKALSHATTSDDATEFKIITGKLTDNNVMLNEYKLLLIIFKSYVNRQIGKLYCRNFNLVLTENENATPLYIKRDGSYDTSSREAFMYEPIENLSSIKEDNRYERIKKIVDIEILNDNVFTKKLYENKEHCNYNREYLLCLFYDIIFTGIKYSTGIYYTFQELIDVFSDIKNKQEKPKIEITVDKNYLVINNNVVLGTHTANINDYKERNKIIKCRLEDTIDFPDGRMSLGVIKKYIEGLYKKETEQPSCSFEFVQKKENNETPGRTGERERLYFKTMLPIFENTGEKK